ncbi:AraC-like DNA-binding protein [Rhizobium sp. BK347]|nr:MULTISPECIES: AraC family transcriptional regulator [unclassified Rhizobium]MBB3285501.1 AraC-like DNA-binding protein [Rhizobium sp. BK252]MBB3400241.1 AraC-like DNA-binding protein [Rhizobium sp. BK289]MBB3412820.1 AraC-like DNA-binding protein [Rhizobium sp. BK284]MBB3480707.1 AraC-like DNA-binding protein [Rhizobium sp. BK347]
MSDLRREEQSASASIEAKDRSWREDRRPQPSDRRRFPRPEKPASEEVLPLPALQPLRFSTRELEPAAQFAAWQTYIAPLVDIRLPDNVSPETGFPADHVAWNLGGMLIVQQDTPPHSYMRSQAKVKANLIDHWHISVLSDGRTWTEVDGRVLEGEPGKIELRSLGHPFRGRSTEAKTLSLFLPRALLFEVPAPVEIENNIALSGIFTGMLIEYLDSVTDNLPRFAATDLPHIVQTVRNMIVASVSTSAAQSTGVEQHSTLAVTERVRRFVESNLAAGDLTVEQICRQLGISRTRLYQIFEQYGGVHHYIQRRRLLSAHAALSDPANREQILDIAFSVGFSSAAHFSRAFSKEFGYSPREARNLTIPRYLGQVASPASPDTHSFEEWLRTLGYYH